MDGLESSASEGKVPPGIDCLQGIRGKEFGWDSHKISVLVITFIAYACYHSSRKPLSIVKSVLDPEQPLLESGNNLIYVRGHEDSFSPESPDFSSTTSVPVPLAGSPQSSVNASTSVIGWAPFNGKHGKARLGEVDLAFLASYSVGMYFSGRLGDRLDLRYFLTVGMLGSGAFVCLFGMGYWWNIHLFSYYFLVQVMGGLLSSTGWPGVVAVVGNWYGKSKRGLIMGIWNGHTSVGNILGSLIAAGALHHGWGWSFALPGIVIIMAGLLVFLYLVVDPKDVGLPSPYEADGTADEDGWAQSHEERKELLVETERRHDVSVFSSEMKSEVPVPLLTNGIQEMKVQNRHGRQSEFAVNESLHGPGFNDPGFIGGHKTGPMETATTEELYSSKSEAIGFLDAWKIPGVAPYAFCLFFVKSVAYTFLFWLPFYIRHTEIAGQYLSDKMAGYLSTLFDVGGVIGGIIAGHLSDRHNASAIVAATFVYTTIPALYLYHVYGSSSLFHSVVFMILLGVFVNGPYALITTAVSADLGTHNSLKGNARALATVTAIIDGTGSIGAAIGPFLTGYISVRSWTAVFVMLGLASLVAGLLLTKLVMAEVWEKVRSRRSAGLGGNRWTDLTEL